MGLLLKRSHNSKARELGDELWNDSNSSACPRIPIDTAMTILVDSSLGRQTYTNQRKILKTASLDILPPWYSLRKEQQVITPDLCQLPDPHVGVNFPLIPSLKLTAQRILQNVPEHKFSGSDIILMNIKFGFDGSGSHAIYHQVNNEKTNNIIMTMFCPLNISSESGSILWEQKSPNNPLTHRPLALQMGKESSDSLKSLEIFNNDILTLNNTGCNIIDNDGQEIVLKVKIQSHMMDMKATHLYLGLGGAYCDLCHFSKEQCCNEDHINVGFEITRDINSLHSLFNELLKDDGSILIKPKDYPKRGGLTTKPIPTSNVLSIQILHALLRTFDIFMKVNVYLRASVFEWSESSKNGNKELIKKAKSEIQKKILSETGLQWDYPDPTGKGGSTTTGNTARSILHNETNRNLVLEMIPEDYQDIMKKFGQELSVIIRVFSSSEDVNVTEYKKLCSELYLYLIQSFPRVSDIHLNGPWISITPSLHKLLAHSWELIELNGDIGLLSLDESGLEGSNKILRGIRTKLSRKTSQNANLADSIRRLWLGSDPKVNFVRSKTKPFCKHCVEFGHSTRYCQIKTPKHGPLSSDDALFQSLILR